MSAEVVQFRRCEQCGSHVPRGEDTCPICGQFTDTLRQLASRSRLFAIGGPALFALLVIAALPDGLFSEPGQSLVEGSVLGAGLAPLVFALAWIIRMRRRRDPRSYAGRIEATEARLEEIERDLADTEARIEAARRELTAEQSARLASNLRRELAQDRRLRRAQRRLVGQLEAQLQSLAIDRFRAELTFYEYCRDQRADAPEEARALAAKIDALRAELGDDPEEAWVRVVEDARALHLQLARGVQRLHAARRLDPLAYADLALPSQRADADAESTSADLEDQTELHLERIDRSFEALDELTADLREDGLFDDDDADAAVDPDASGLRLRVDDDVIAALDLDEPEPELAPRELGQRTSVDSI